MVSVAVVAHSGKTFGGGPDELRASLAAAGHRKPTWYEVARSSMAPKAIRRAVKDGANLIFVWGGDARIRHLTGDGTRTSTEDASRAAGAVPR